MVFSTDLISCTIFGLRRHSFEQSNFERILDLIAFLRRTKLISGGCLPRNCRQTANSNLQMAKKPKNHRFAVKPPKLPEGRLQSHLRGECFRTIKVPHPNGHALNVWHHFQWWTKEPTHQRGDEKEKIWSKEHVPFGRYQIGDDFRKEIGADAGINLRSLLPLVAGGGAQHSPSSQMKRKKAEKLEQEEKKRTMSVTLPGSCRPELFRQRN